MKKFLLVSILGSALICSAQAAPPKVTIPMPIGMKLLAASKPFDLGELQFQRAKLRGKPAFFIIDKKTQDGYGLSISRPMAVEICTIELIHKASKKKIGTINETDQGCAKDREDEMGVIYHPVNLRKAAALDFKSNLSKSSLKCVINQIKEINIVRAMPELAENFKIKKPIELFLSNNVDKSVPDKEASMLFFRPEDLKKGHSTLIGFNLTSNGCEPYRRDVLEKDYRTLNEKNAPKPVGKTEPALKSEQPALKSEQPAPKTDADGGADAGPGPGADAGAGIDPSQISPDAGVIENHPTK